VEGLALEARVVVVEIMVAVLLVAAAATAGLRRDYCSSVH
jgi:hypothetical protein